MALPLTYQSRLIQKIQHTARTKDFVLELSEPESIEFKAGQFVIVKGTRPDGSAIQRSYSIASAPQQTSQLVLNIEILPHGQFTPIMDGWDIGSDVTFQGPFGHFVFKSPGDVDLVFVGTGTGVAPLKSMIEDQLNRGSKQKMHLYFGLRSQEHIFYQDHFEALAQKHENFDFTLCLSRPEEGWDGFSGRVTALLPTLKFQPNTHFYLCGGKPMIDDVKALLNEKGFEKSHIFFEQFFL